MRLQFCIGAALLSIALGGCDGLFGQSAEQKVAAARDAFAARHYEESLVLLKSVVRDNGSDAEARALLGRTHLALYDFQSAEKELVRAQQLGAPIADYLPALGNTWLTLGKVDQVLKEIDPESASDPKVKAALLTVIGKARLRQVELKGQREHLADAETAFRAAVAADPSQPDALAGLGRVDFYENKPDEADAQISAALALAPGNIDALSLKGDIALSQGRAGEAVDAFTRATQSDPLNPFTLMGLSWAQLSAGQAKAAIPNIDRLMKDLPPNQPVTYQRALAAHLTGDEEGTLRYAEKALSMGDHLPSILLAGSAAYALGRYEIAFKYLRGYVAAVPQADEARRLLAATALHLGQVQTAVDSLSPIAEPQSPNDARLFAAVGDAAVQAGMVGTGRRMVALARQATPDTSDGLTGLSRTLINAGETGQAIEDLEHAVQMDPKNAEAHARLIISYVTRRELDKALEAAVRFEKALPDSPKGFVLEGIIHGLKQDVFQSRAAFEQALKIQPGEPDAANNLAALLLRGGDRDGARKLYDSVLEHDPTNLKTLLNYANLELQAGDKDAAISRLQAAVKAHGDSAEAMAALGGVYVDTNQPQAAIDAVKPGLDKHPTDLTLLNITGKAQLALGENQEAIETLSQVNKARPDLVFPAIYLAQAYGNSGDLEKAVETVQQASVANPNNRPLKIELARLQGVAGRIDDAKKTVAELKQAAPDAGDTADLEATIALAEGNPEQAVAILRKVPPERMTNYVKIQLAKALMAAGQADQAFGELEAWLETYPQDALTRTVLAGSYLREGRYEAARDHYARLVAQIPDNVSNLNDLAWATFRLGDAEGALTFAEKARKLQPDDPNVGDTTGVILMSLKRNDEALPILASAHEAAPKDPAITVHYARALAEAKRQDEAIALLREALDSKQPFADRSEAESLLKELGG